MEQFTPETTIKKQKVKPMANATSNSMVKVFLWLGLGLLITGVVSLGMPDFLLFLMNTLGVTASAANTTYTVLMVVSALVMFPSIIVMNMKAWRPKSGVMIAGYVTYCLAMGVLLSSMMMEIFALSVMSSTSFVKTISVAFLATAGSFLIMGLIGGLSKKNLGVLLPFLSSLMIGACAISLVNLFLGSETIYWIIDFAMFAVILLVVAVDLNHVKRIAAAGGFTSENNMAIYCAYYLYVDFINLFIRIVYYVAISASRDRR